MKKVIKIICFVLTFTLMFQITNMPVLASGYSTYSNTVVYINNYPIPSTKFNNKIYLMVSDLLNYGFNTSWNEYSRVITITRNVDKNEIDVLPTFLPTDNCLGKAHIQFLDTDIKININGTFIETYGSPNGNVYFDVNSLNFFENISVAYRSDIDAYKIWISDLNDGLNVPWQLRKLDYQEKNYTGYNENCDTLYLYDSPGYIEEYGDVFCISGAFYNNDKTMGATPKGTFRIIDIIDANGKSRKLDGRTYALEYYVDNNSYTILPYFQNLTDFKTSFMFWFNSEELKPSSANDGRGLVKWEFESDDYIWSGEFRTENLPNNY